METIYSLSDMFARGGGGGSGGGSGGGGGGILLVGYVPTYYFTSYILKKLGSMWAVILGGLFSLIWGGFLFVLLFDFLGFMFLLSALIGFFFGYFGLHHKILRKAKAAKAEIKKAATLDPAWEPEYLDSRVRQVFLSYQQDWSNFNTSNISTYTSDSYAYHSWLMISALSQLSRKNQMDEVEIKSIQLVGVTDNDNNNHDKFEAFITAKAKDQLIDMQTNKIIYTDKSIFQEYWTFSRHPQKGWVLDSIKQISDVKTSKTNRVRKFAIKNNLYFSLDWGWLLLPMKGEIFSKAKFGNSDINNHCIGIMGEELVQLYTYVPVKTNGRAIQETIVAQIAVPNKNYGRIVIKQKNRWKIFERTPKGLNKLEVEAMEINKRFNIYATDVEQVTTFELLNPLYMQQVIDTAGKINIEVYDNTIFIYTTDYRVKYDAVFNLLVKAHKELVR